MKNIQRIIMHHCLITIKKQRIHAKPKVIAAEALGSQNWMCFGLQIVNIGLAPLPT
jgi:hypothetical protein